MSVFKYTLLFLLIVSFVAHAQKDSLIGSPPKVNQYKNALGLKIAEGISYRHYFNDFGVEVNALPQGGGYYGLEITNSIMVFYQKNTNHRLQPYFGIGLADVIHTKLGVDTTFFAYNRSQRNEKIFYAKFMAKVGVELLSKKRHWAFCADIGYGNPFAGINNNKIPLQINFGVRYRFTRKR